MSSANYFSLEGSKNLSSGYGLTHQQQTVFENIVGIEDSACKEQFRLYPRFLLNKEIVSPFVNIFDIISLFAAELEEPKIGM